MINPFQALRPQNSVAEEIISPPYDVLNSKEALAHAKHKPLSFLHVSKPEIDLEPDTDPHAEIVYQTGTQNLQRLIDTKNMRQDDSSCFYIYRLQSDSHVQTGLVSVLDIEDYLSNRIRRHEHTHPDKEKDRVDHMLALNAQTGPVMMAYKNKLGIQDVIETLTESSPHISAKADDGVVHSLWVIRDDTHIQRLTTVFEQLDTLYIADGHHRSAAAARSAETKRQANTQHNGTEPYNYFLGVLFPDSELQILGYNRVVRDLNGLSTDEYLARLQDQFVVDAVDRPLTPDQSGVFGMYLENTWYRLALRDDQVDLSDPIEHLDVSILTNCILHPILGVRDLRRDPRVDFIGGARGNVELERRVNSGEMIVAFALYPTQLADLMTIADAGEVMPPKSTWFEPKLADGLLIHMLD